MKAPASHHQVSSKLAEKWAVVPTAPLDFSFKDIANIEDAVNEEPRKRPLVRIFGVCR
ncbi:hypothetical protein HDU96_000628 [Phlyctochytrium bullatum]|nr:hypothetical protein HDU96_000628 [Phlyctochytrium bullatum]